MENIVYNELLVRGYNVDVGIVDVFAKNSEGKRVHKQLEVDFVVNQGSQRYYIQVAYDMTSEEKQTQELNSLRNIPDSFKKIIIVNGTKKPWRNEEGFVIMGMKYDVCELLRACYYAIDKKPITQVPLTLKEKMLLKTVMKKVKGTDIEILMKESGLIE